MFIIHANHLSVTKLSLTCYSPLHRKMIVDYHMWAMRANAADWLGGMSACCTTGLDDRMDYDIVTTLITDKKG